MPIDGKLLNSVATSVHRTQQVVLAGNECEGAVIRRLAVQVGLFAREAHLAVDQVAVRERLDGPAFADWSEQASDVGHVIVAVPV